MKKQPLIHLLLITGVQVPERTSIFLFLFFRFCS